MLTQGRRYHIGIIGTGFIARGVMMALAHYPQLVISKVLTRRKKGGVDKLPVNEKLLTHRVDDVISQSDLVVECSGDPVHGTEAVYQILKAGIPVVTMDSELQIVSGTQLIKHGTLIEAEGDQPGSLAALDLDVKAMGFKPVVYGNMKGFLNLNPKQADMEFWAEKQGISLNQVTAFTDGSKVQIEQAVVANGLGATITQRGLTGVACTDYDSGVKELAAKAEGLDKPISDYIVLPGGVAGVFIVAEHEQEQVDYLRYLKLGDGPKYIITRPFHLCHLEVPKTIMKVLAGDMSYSFNNGANPKIQVAAVAKREIKAGEQISRALGSFDFRGEAVLIEDEPEIVPITLLSQATIKHDLDPGGVVRFADVQLKPSLALKFWQETVKEVTDQKIVWEEKRNEEKKSIFKAMNWFRGLSGGQNLAGV